MSKINLLLCFILCFMLEITSVQAAIPANAENIPIYNSAGRKIAAEPGGIICRDTTMLPLQAMADILGAEIAQQQGSVLLRRDDRQLCITPGSKFAQQEINETRQQLTLPEAAFYQDSSLMVPLRAVAEFFGEKINFCVDKSPYNVYYPVIILGESEYAANLTYEDLNGKTAESADIRTLQAELAALPFSLDELTSIICFLREPLSLYAEADTNSLNATAESIRQFCGYYISAEVLCSKDWQTLTALARPFKREWSGAVVRLTGDRAKLTGTYCANLYAGFLTIPLVFDFTLECQGAEWAMQAPKNPLSGEAWAQLADEVGAWQITKIGSPRAYINLQALRAQEAGVYNRLLAAEALLMQ